MGDPVQPANIDAVVENHEPEGWEVLRSEPRWDVWDDHHRRRPRTRQERRGRIAAATAGAIMGVLSVGGLVSYAVQWQSLHNTTLHSLRSESLGYLELNPGPDPNIVISEAVATAEKQPPGSEGMVGVVNGKVAVATTNAAGPAADAGFASTVQALSSKYIITTDIYSSKTTECVYQVIPFWWEDGSSGAIVRVVDLKPAWTRMNLGYLTYGLVSLGIAGAAGGTVYWRLGRGRNDKAEPENP